MMEGWQQLKERERWAVGLAGTALLIYLFYAFVYSPLNTAVFEKEQEYVEKTQTLALMKAVEHMGLNQSEQAVITNPQLLTLITAAFKQSSFQGFPYQIQQTASGDIQVGFVRVPYGVMIQWLWELVNRYRIDVKQISIVSLDAPGIVECHMTLTVK